MIASDSISKNYKKTLLPNGIHIAYTEQGKGKETILFIHGLGSFSGTWTQNTDSLAQHYRCIAIDLPGNGHSDKGDYPYSIAFYAQSVADFIAQMKLTKLNICAHSMGGQVALHLLQSQPSIAAKLILCATAGFERFNVFEKTMYRTAIGFMDMLSTDESNIRNSIFSSFYNYPQQVDAMVAELVALLKSYPPSLYKKMIDRSVQAMMDEPVYDRLGEIQNQCLVIFGTADALIPNKLIHPISTEQLAKQAVAKMPHAQLEMIDYAGHFVQWEKAEKVNELIVTFLSKD